MCIPPASVELEPAERLLAAVIRTALKDARQDKNLHQRNEALRFLWSVAPIVAKRMGLPAVDVQQQ